MTTTLKSADGKILFEFERYDNPNFISTEETPDEIAQHTRRIQVTLRKVCVAALTAKLDSDKQMSGIEKNKLFVLSLRLQQEDKPELISEEITKIKKRIGEMQGIEIVGKSYAILDPKTDEEKKKTKGK